MTTGIRGFISAVLYLGAAYFVRLAAPRKDQTRVTIESPVRTCRVFQEAAAPLAPLGFQHTVGSLEYVHSLKLRKIAYPVYAIIIVFSSPTAEFRVLSTAMRELLI